MRESNLEKDWELRTKKREIAEKNRELQDLRTELESQVLFRREHGTEKHYLEIKSLIEAVEKKDAQIRKNAHKPGSLKQEMQTRKYLLHQLSNLQTKGN